MDGENNFFYGSQYENQSQDYFPNLENIPNSGEFLGFNNTNSQYSQTSTNSLNPEYQQTFQNTSQGAPQTFSNPSIWSEQEDIALMSAWCFVSTNPIVGKNQHTVSFWTKIKNLYDDARRENPNLGPERSIESLRQRARRINKNVTAWIAVYKKAYDRRTSGQSMEDIEKVAQTLFGKSKFTHHEVLDKVMRHYPSWELKLNTSGCTRSRPNDDDDNVDESRGSSKKSRTDEDEDPLAASTPETPGSEGSILSRPIGRDKAKAKAKRKGKATTSQSSIVLPDEFQDQLRDMSITRAKEVVLKERELAFNEKKMKNNTLLVLMGKSQLTPAEEALKSQLMAELYGV